MTARPASEIEAEPEAIPGSSMVEAPLSVVIPTYGRDAVLVETIESVLSLNPHEVLVIDQTSSHEAATLARLQEMNGSGAIRLVCLPEPNIPRAMNAGLIRAVGEIVLFLDDDVVPSPDLIFSHKASHLAHRGAWVVVGQILQPGQLPQALDPGEPFRFNSTAPAWIDLAMAGNMSVKRDRAILAGGFDENFLGAAYMFETEFAGRVLRGGGRIFFEPSASIRHLRAPRGGTRSHGSHLRTLSPAHASGAYYHMFLTFGMVRAVAPVLRRFFSSVATRHHLRHPWWIPVTLIAELRGLLQGIFLFRKGPQLLQKGGAS